MKRHDSSTETRDAADVRIFPPGVPLLTIVLGAVLHKVRPLDFGGLFPVPARYWIGGAIVLGSLFFLGVWSITIFHHEGQSPKPWEPSPTLVARGPFRVTRNPMYLQMVLSCLGCAVLLDNVWMALLTPVAAWVLQRFVILPEEAYLERRFGDDYLAYKRRVRRWI